jgi:hypothetical protein
MLLNDGGSEILKKSVSPVEISKKIGYNINILKMIHKRG